METVGNNPNVSLKPSFA